MIDNESLYMARCFQLAAMGRGAVEPNPMVGAVLVYQDQIIGEGYHRNYGGPHAEVNCIASVREENRSLIPKATLYVSLEPCHHHGKTPPCTDLILEHGIKKVVIGSLDFNVDVHGHGVELLLQQGVEVVNKNDIVRQKELNISFFINKRYHKPYTIAKWAQSADGYIGAAGERTIITSPEVDARMHQLRSVSKAIVVGKNTFRIDKPLLTTRMIAGRDPHRVTLDTNLENIAWYGDYGQLTVLHSKETKSESLGDFEFVEDTKNVPLVLDVLYKRHLDSVLIEGGQQVLQSFFDQDQIDVYYKITNEALALGSGISAPSPKLHSFKCIETTFIGTQKIEKYLHKRIWGE